jgi:hypothetical protein
MFFSTTYVTARDKVIREGSQERGREGEGR